jgi:hypothetical protein
LSDDEVKSDKLVSRIPLPDPLPENIVLYTSVYIIRGKYAFDWIPPTGWTFAVYSPHLQKFKNDHRRELGLITDTLVRYWNTAARNLLGLRGFNDTHVENLYNSASTFFKHWNCDVSVILFGKDKELEGVVVYPITTQNQIALHLFNPGVPQEWIRFSRYGNAYL